MARAPRPAADAARRRRRRLRAHSVRAGARAVVLAPTRELALQTHKVVKELGRYTDLRTAVLVGGDSMEAQFAELAANPDIIVATPGARPPQRQPARLRLCTWRLRPVYVTCVCIVCVWAWTPAHVRLAWMPNQGARARGWGACAG